MFARISANITSIRDKVASLKTKPDPAYEKRIRELKSNIEHTRTEMKLAMENFNNVTEPKLVDFYIYKIQSEQTRYEQLISEYKTLENLYENIDSVKESLRKKLLADKERIGLFSVVESSVFPLTCCLHCCQEHILTG